MMNGTLSLPETQVGLTATQIAAWLRTLVPAGSVVELRALNVPQTYGRPKTAFGYFDSLHLDVMATEAVQLSNSGATGVYWTLNPVDPDLLARAANRVRDAGKGDTTCDINITSRRWLLIDADPTRPSGISSTDQEKAEAGRVINDVQRHLTELGWPAPVVADSGNGFHLLYRVDLPAADDSLIKQVLESLANRFNYEHVDIDRAVFNPSRICKLYGTVGRKGDHLEGLRPHRVSSVLEIPAELIPVPIELLRVVAVVTPAAPQTACPASPPPVCPVSPPPNRGRQSHLLISAKLGRARRYLAKIPAAVSGQHGHNATFHAACALVKGFDLTPDEVLPLLQQWNETCQPPWSEAELRHKLADADRQPSERGELFNRARIAAATPVTDSVRVGEAQPSPLSSQFRLNLIPSSEFATADYRQRFLVRRVLVEGQPCIVGGPKKALKTATMIDLAVSLSTGTPFLGKPEFSVPEQVNVAILSGESGMYTLQETARRVACAHGVSLGDCAIWWEDRLPQLANLHHIAALTDAIREHSIKVCMIDPAYLCLLSGDTQGRQASNMFDVGSLLLGLTNVTRETGCGIILAHHTRKNPTEKFAIPELQDLAFAGFSEFARQWLLLNRRADYEPGTGHHELWLSIGGSAGHSSAWAYTADEGVVDDDFNGRFWRPTVTPAGEAISQARTAKNQQRENDRRARILSDSDRIATLLRQAPESLTKSEMKDRLALSATNFNPAFAGLLARGTVDATRKLAANGQTYDAFRISVGQPGRPTDLSDRPDVSPHTLGQGA